MKRKFKLKITDIIIFIIFAIVIYIEGSMLVNVVTKKEATISFLDWKPFIVAQDFKNLELYENDIAIVKDVDVNDLKVSDIVVYKKNDEVIISKVGDIAKINGNSKVIIKSDYSVVDSENLEGKYIFRLAGLGTVLRFLQNPLIGGLIILIFTCMVCIYNLMGTETIEYEGKE